MKKPGSLSKTSAGLSKAKTVVIKYLNTDECRPKLQERFVLARKKFKSELMYEIDERTHRRNNSPHSLCAAAYHPQTNEILSYLAVTVSDMAFRDGILSGRYDENDLYPYDGTHGPVLVFDTLIVTSHIHAPFLVRQITKDLHRLIQLDELNIVGGMSIGGLRTTQRWMKRLGFHEIGKYRGHYPVMWATRQQSAMLNSLCTPRAD